MQALFLDFFFAVTRQSKCRNYLRLLVGHLLAIDHPVTHCAAGATTKRFRVSGRGLLVSGWCVRSSEVGAQTGTPSPIKKKKHPPTTPLKEKEISPAPDPVPVHHARARECESSQSLGSGAGAVDVKGD
jgi:hypothetical protein